MMIDSLHTINQYRHVVGIVLFVELCMYFFYFRVFSLPSFLKKINHNNNASVHHAITVCRHTDEYLFQEQQQLWHTQSSTVLDTRFLPCLQQMEVVWRVM